VSSSTEGYVEGYRRFWEQSQERYDRLDEYLAGG
jgi:hypothetical protein